jgi:hypothetical protein
MFLYIFSRNGYIRIIPIAVQKEESIIDTAILYLAFIIRNLFFKMI